MTKVNLLQSLRNRTADAEPDAVTSSRVIHIEFLPEQQDHEELTVHARGLEEQQLEGDVIELHSFDMTAEVKVDPSQIV